MWLAVSATCCMASRSVTTDLLQRYLEVEEVFQADGATEQEVIDSLRKACCYPIAPQRPTARDGRISRMSVSGLLKA